MKNNYSSKVQCLICKKFYFHPMSHCWQTHGVLSKDYKKMFGLDNKKGLICPGLKQVMREKVLEHPDIIVGLTKNGEKSRFQKGDKTIGKYDRSPQTLAVLAKLSRTRTTILKTCFRCGKEKLMEARRKWCLDCMPVIEKSTLTNPKDLSEYQKKWYEERNKDPGFRKLSNSYSYNLKRVCKVCKNPIVNKCKTGLCKKHRKN